MSNAPQTGQFFNVDALARLPDAWVIIVDEILRPDIDVLFPAMVVVGVKGTPKAHLALSGRSVYVWVIDPEPKLPAISEVARETVVVGGVQSPAAFLGNPGRVRAHVLANRRKVEPAPRVEPAIALRPTLGVVERDGSVRSPQVNEDIEELPTGYSQDAIAAAFTKQFDDWRYVNEWGRWLAWDGLRWKQDTILSVFNNARGVCRDQADKARAEYATAGAIRTIQSANTIAAVVRIACADPVHAATTETWDFDPWVINTPNGIVDLRDGEMRPSTPDDHLTKLTRVAPGGDCHVWRKFLHETTKGDVELQSFMQRMAGYCLTGITREHALFFVYGTGGNGKGTFLNMLTWIMGDYQQVASMETFTEARGERHPTELAGLMGARLVAAQETEEGRRWAESRIKALTGGDPIRARFMRKDEFTFMPQFKLVIVGNHKPGLRNVDEAIKRRLYLIPFMQKPVKKDLLLPEKLQAEAGGIFKWMIEGCLEWQRIGLAPPSVVRIATDQYLTSQDIIATWMAECCDVASTWSSKVGETYSNYKQWAERNNEPTLGRKRFVEALESRGYVTEELSGNFWIRGLKVENDQKNY